MTKEEARQEILELSRQINHYNHLYYQENRSEISDYDFDQLLDKLIQLEQKFPEFSFEDSPTKRVGGCLLYTSPSPRD